MRRSTIAVLALPVIIAVSLFSQARGQYGWMWANPYTGSMWNNPGSSLLDTMIQGSIFAPTQSATTGGAYGGGGADAEPEAELAPATVTSFRAATGRLEVVGFAESLTADPVDHDVFIQALDEGITLFEQAARGLGRPNNVALR